MPDREFNIDMRDMRFALLEASRIDELLRLPKFEGMDKDSIQLMMDEAYKFHRDQVAPIDGPGDKQGCRFEDGKVTVPDGFKKAYEAICDANWLAISNPEEMGGLGLPYAVELACGETQVGACCSLSLSVGLTNAAASLIGAFGTEEIKDTYLPKLTSGKWQGTMCLTEPQAGTAVGDSKTMAKKVGDKWHISGTKIFITGGEHDMTENHVHLVLARSEGAPKGIKGLSLFLVPKFRLDENGNPGEFNDVVCAGIEHKMGIKASPTCVMQFGENDGCEGYLIGEECQGIKHMFHMMNHARIGVGLQGVALAAQGYLYALEYAKERVQGSDIENMKDPNAARVTIKNHPDVKRMLMMQKAIVEGTRALLYEAGIWHDIALYCPEKPCRDEAHGVLEFLTPVVKAYISDMAFESTRLAIQCLGGYGYISEYPVEQRMRDVKIASIYEGTNGVQALDLLGRKLTTKAGLYFRQMLGMIQRFAKEYRGHPTLEKEFAGFEAAVEAWSKTTMQLGMKGMSGDRRYPVLCATSYLELTGNICCAWLLLRQAVVAHVKLEEMHAEHDAQSWDEREELYRDDAEARFFFNKIETARFFVHNVLTRNQGIVDQIASDDRSALNFIID